MRRAWIAVVAVAALAVPATGFAHGDDRSERGDHNTSKMCKALRAEMGTELFREAYGSSHNRRNAHGKCVSKHRHGMKRLIAQAISECRAEQAALRHFKSDDDSSDAERRAFRQCVKDKLAQLLAARRAAFEAAVKSCDAERSADAAAFEEKYGKGHKQRHAFFRCVAQTFRANLEAAKS